MLGISGIGLVLGGFGIWRSYDYITTTFVDVVATFTGKTPIVPPLDMWYIGAAIITGFGFIAAAIYSATH
ncbi:MAG: hypothetical protein ACREBA_07740 [Nitrosotalea sp.]